MLEYFTLGWAFVYRISVLAIGFGKWEGVAYKHARRAFLNSLAFVYPVDSQ